MTTICVRSMRDLSQGIGAQYAIIGYFSHIFAQTSCPIGDQGAGEHAVGEPELDREAEIITEYCLSKGQQQMGRSKILKCESYK